jgi:hypothetical protein
VPGGLLRHAGTGALWHRLYPPSVCDDQFFRVYQQPPGPRGPHVSACPACPHVMPVSGHLIMRMPARLCGCRRAADTSAGLPHLACPAGAGQRARRGQALSAIRRPRRAGKDYQSLRGIFTNRRCGPAPFPLAAFSNLEIPGQGSGMTPLRRDGKWPAPAPRPVGGRRAADGGGTTPGRDGPERLAGGTWLRAGPQRPGRNGRVRNGGRPADSRVGCQKARPWPRPRTGLDRSLSGPQLAQVPPGRRDRAGRIPPAWLLIPIWPVRHQCPLTVRERRLGDQNDFRPALPWAANPEPGFSWAGHGRHHS